MIHKEMKPQLVETVTGFTCDRCGKQVFNDDVFDAQEAHHVDFVGGYGSVFGDGARVECDLCQSCLKHVLDGIARVTR